MEGTKKTRVVQAIDDIILTLQAIRDEPTGLPHTKNVFDLIDEIKDIPPNMCATIVKSELRIAASEMSAHGRIYKGKINRLRLACTKSVWDSQRPLVKDGLVSATTLGFQCDELKKRGIKTWFVFGNGTGMQMHDKTIPGDALYIEICYGRYTLGDRQDIELGPAYGERLIELEEVIQYLTTWYQ